MESIPGVDLTARARTDQYLVRVERAPPARLAREADHLEVSSPCRRGTRRRSRARPSSDPPDRRYRRRETRSSRSSPPPRGLRPAHMRSLLVGFGRLRRLRRRPAPSSFGRRLRPVSSAGASTIVLSGSKSGFSLQPPNPPLPLPSCMIPLPWLPALPDERRSPSASAASKPARARSRRGTRQGADARCSPVISLLRPGSHEAVDVCTR
jgi:hypothetical protein